MKAGTCFLLNPGCFMTGSLVHGFWNNPHITSQPFSLMFTWSFQEIGRSSRFAVNLPFPTFFFPEWSAVILVFFWWKIMMVHLQITHEKKGKWSEPNLHDYVPAVNLQGGKLHDFGVFSIGAAKGRKLPLKILVYLASRTEVWEKNMEGLDFRNEPTSTWKLFILTLFQLFSN